MFRCLGVNKLGNTSNIFYYTPPRHHGNLTELLIGCLVAMVLVFVVVIYCYRKYLMHRYAPHLTPNKNFSVGTCFSFRQILTITVIITFRRRETGERWEREKRSKRAVALEARGRYHPRKSGGGRKSSFRKNAIYLISKKEVGWKWLNFWPTKNFKSFVFYGYHWGVTKILTD